MDYTTESANRFSYRGTMNRNQDEMDRCSENNRKLVIVVWPINIHKYDKQFYVTPCVFCEEGLDMLSYCINPSDR